MAAPRSWLTSCSTILHLNGQDLRPLPLIERKAMLAKLLAKLPVRSAVQFSADVTGQGPEFFALACKRHLEGIVSKRAAAPYRSGRAPADRPGQLLIRCRSKVGREGRPMDRTEARL